MTVLLTTCPRPPAWNSGSGKPGFRIRSDFVSTLNSEQGWAGALNENVTVNADQPFRIRFEWERLSGQASGQQFRLQYRRNSGIWTDVEAHDFPHPEREISMDFTHFEGARADQEPLVGIFSPPWDVSEMVFQFRLAPDNQKGIAFTTGFADINNYCRIQLDPNPGSIRVSQVINGIETNLAEKHTVIPYGQWLEIEIDTEKRGIGINYQNEMMEMDVKVETDIPLSKLGFQIPPNTTVDFQQFSFAGEAKSPRVSIVTCPGY
ncbi:MAG: hypothetical protein ACYTFE_04840, partial [Planctomycetota bacterium]